MSHRNPLSLLYSVRYRRAVLLPPTSLVSHRKPLSLLYSVRYRRAVSLPLTSLVSHRKSLSLLYSVRYRRTVSLPLTSLVSHRKSLSLLLPLAAVELVSPTDGGHYSSSVRSSHLTRSARDISQLTDKKSPSCTLFDIGVLFRSRSHHLYLTESRSPFFCHWQRSSLFLPPAAVITCPLFVRLVSLAPLAILRNSQIKNLPSSATGGGRFFIPIFWRQQQSYRPES